MNDIAEGTDLNRNNYQFHKTFLVSVNFIKLKEIPYLAKKLLSK